MTNANAPGNDDSDPGPAQWRACGPDPGDQLRLAELVATRLCHDLSGPLGTLMGSLEMLAEEPESAEEALTLAGDVSVVLGNRLRLLRAAWAGGTPALGVADLKSMAQGLATRRLRLDLDDIDAGIFTPAAARVTLNVLMLACDCLPAGGMVIVRGNPQGDLLVILDGDRAAWPPGFAHVLNDPAQAWKAVRESTGVEASRNLQAPLTALIARNCDIRLSLLMDGGGGVTPPPLLLTMGRS